MNLDVDVPRDLSLESRRQARPNQTPFQLSSTYSYLVRIAKSTNPQPIMIHAHREPSLPNQHLPAAESSVLRMPTLAITL